MSTKHDEHVLQLQNKGALDFYAESAVARGSQEDLGKQHRKDACATIPNLPTTAANIPFMQPAHSRISIGDCGSQDKGLDFLRCSLPFFVNGVPK